MQEGQQMQEQNQNTLNEPIKDTLMRDFKMIYVKVKHVMFPYKNQEAALKKWDLWGPLIFCMVLASTLSIQSTKDSNLVFATVFVVIWVGSFVVTLNTKLLKGQISFLQSVSILGYCIFPITLASLLLTFIDHFIPYILKIVIVAISFIWSTQSSKAFMANQVTPNKKLLAIYPIFLFYLFLATFILII